MTVLATLPLARLSTAALLSAVTDATKPLGNRPSVPVLAGLRLHKLDNHTLEVAGFNYETSIRRRVQMEGDLPDVLVPGAVLRTALKNLNAKEEVTLAVDGGKFLLMQGRKKVTLNPLDLDDYPDLPPVPTRRDFTMTGEQLHFIGTKVAVFAGRDDYLPVLTGVKFTVEDGVLTVAATDRYRLAMAEFPVQMPAKRGSDEISPLVPQVPLICGLLKNAGNVAVSLVRDPAGIITFHTDDTTITTRVLDGEFPKVRSLFPAETFTKLIVNPTEMLAAIKFAETAIERNTPVHLTMGDGQVQVSGKSGEETFSDTVVAAMAGADELVVGANPTYLTDALKVWGKGHAVTIGFTQATKPMVFTSPAAENLRLLLMPVRINN